MQTKVVFLKSSSILKGRIKHLYYFVWSKFVTNQWISNNNKLRIYRSRKSCMAEHLSRFNSIYSVISRYKARNSLIMMIYECFDTHFLWYLRRSISGSFLVQEERRMITCRMFAFIIIKSYITDCCVLYAQLETSRSREYSTSINLALIFYRRSDRFVEWVVNYDEWLHITSSSLQARDVFLCYYNGGGIPVKLVNIYLSSWVMT